MNIRTVMTAALSCALATTWLAGPTVAGDSLTSAHAAPAASIPDAPDGVVNDIAIAPDGTTYAVGNFTSVGAATGGLARLDASTAVVNRAFPAVNGSVNAMVADPAGGFFIGGSFDYVGGYARGGLARITSSGEVDPNWNPAVGSAYVSALTLRGSTLYFGGEFTIAGPPQRKNLGAIDAATGVLLPWAPRANSGVTALASDDTSIYVAGNFTTIDDSTQVRLAALDPSTGVRRSWSPAPDAGPSVLIVDDTTLYAAGAFTTFATGARTRLAAFRTDTLTLTSWAPTPNASVTAMAVDDSVAYVTGYFTTMNGVSRTRAAAVRLDDTGTETSWGPLLSSNGTSILSTSSGVYIGGSFSTVNGANKQVLAKVDKESGSLMSWAPSPSAAGGAAAFTLLDDSASVIAGGSFALMNSVPRNRAAAFDASQRVTSWAPSTNNAVNAMALSGTTAYLVGNFTQAGNGVVRNYAAAFRTDDTGSLTSWDPNLNSVGRDIAIAGSTAYLVGSFTTANNGAKSRYRAVAVDLVNGTANDWNPSLGSVAFAIAIDDTLAYLGGAFTTVGNETRNRVAAISTDAAGVLASWNPNVGQAGAAVYDIALSGSTAYLAGTFTIVGGASRRGAAAVRTDDTGSPTSWRPTLACVSCTPPAGGHAIQVLDAIAVVGGNFDQVNGANGIAAIAAFRTDDSGSHLPSWRPVVLEGMNPPVTNALATSGSTLLTGGDFAGIVLAGSWYPGYLAALPRPLAAPSAPTAVAAVAGNASASISWTPGSNGGSPVTRVDFAVDDTSTVRATTTNTTSPYTLTGLTNGQTYTAYVRLANSVGDGQWSSVSAPFTPTAPPAPPVPPVPLSPPGAPTAVSATAGNASANVTWSPPQDSGSFPISRYQVTASPGGQTCTSTTTTCLVSGLTNGMTYTFTVTASSAAGSGPASAPSNAVTPRTVPGPPTDVTATPGIASARMTWSPPADDGGSPIAGYRVSTTPASAGCATEGADTCLLKDLAAGTDYAVTVIAINAAGESAPSSPVTVIPRGEPSILITGSRDGFRITVSGTITNADVSKVRPRYRLDGQKRFRTADVAPPVVKGTFTWGRVANRSIAVYVVAQGLISNRVFIRSA